MDKDIICNFDNLYEAYKKAKRGKKCNGSAARFQMIPLEGVHILKEQLESQTYQMNPYNKFMIHEPKEREIKSCSFKDKVVQHCLCDNILHPYLENVFFTDNYAGQIGKGTLFGMTRLKQQMCDFYKENGTNGWILKCDIKKYFYSIDHKILIDIVDYFFPDQYTQWLNHLFIESTESPGLPLGNQVAQIYALLVLHMIDQLVVCDLGIKYYGRYMDDFFLIHHDKEYLKMCLEAIQEMASTLKLSLNGKTQIVSFRKGIRFLGFHHYMTDEGKYIRKINGENKRRIRKKIRKWVKAVGDGRMTMDKFYEKYNSWKNHASHGNCIKLCRSMDEYANELMKEFVNADNRRELLQ